MFIGEYSHTIDNKRRLAIPARFRKELGKKAVITRGLDNCLFVFPESEWAKLAEKLGALPLGQSDARGFIRLMLAGAMDVKLDGQGRIILPDYLRRFAGLKKDAVVAGLHSRLEIWDTEEWQKYQTGTEADSQQIAERMGELGV